jgi:hypothetical protein
MTVQQGQAPESRQGVRAVASRVVTFYRGCALVFFNTVVGYVLLNVLLGTAFWVYDKSKGRSQFNDIPVTAAYSPELLDKVYPGFARDEWKQVIAEAWTRPYVFDDFTHFKERPCVGRYVNVTEEGYRQSVNQGPWPPSPENVNIFVFGASTMFGYGLPDDQTVPSFLQQALAKHSRRRVCVYNFAVAWYFSTQERLRFEKLLLDGYVPDIVFFVDGIADAYHDPKHLDNKPAFSREMAQAFEHVAGFADSQSPSRARGAWAYWEMVKEVTYQRLPIRRAVDYVLRKLKSQGSGSDWPTAQSDKDTLRRGCNTYLTNQFLIEQLCQRFGVTPVFVWQPGPGYKHDLKYHSFVRAEDHPFRQMEDYYSTLREVLQQRPPCPHFLWCADIQEGRTDELYCDGTHYNIAFAKVFADYIGQLCVERKLLDKHLAR